MLTRYAIDWYILPRNIGGLKWIALAYLAVQAPVGARVRVSGCVTVGVAGRGWSSAPAAVA